MLSLFRSAPADRLTVPQIADAVARGDMTLLDVREPAEIAASGKARGALTIPVGIVAIKADPAAPDRAAGLSTDRPVAVYCAAGGRSGMAVQALTRLGYQAVNIGGFGDWVAGGGQIER